ncbi:MAG: MFS transporter [Deltaproteobacteria bacterium]|nr:MFS transporter [Deltaproteobacteria bacterium]
MIQKHTPEIVRPELIAYKWKAVTTVSLSILMVTMDFSINNIAFPILTKVFGAGITTIIWVSLAYTLSSTSLLLVLGRIGDLMGRKRILASGMAIFAFGLLICSVAQGIGQLITFRIIQGVGAAMAISCGTAIVTESFPPEERGKGLGIIGIAVAGGLVLGPVVGGLLLQWFDWRSIYYTRIPVGLFALIMTMVLLKKDTGIEGKLKIDFLGILTSSIGIACIIFGVSQIKGLAFQSVLVPSMIGIGILCIIAFIFIERRAKDPIVDLTLFRSMVFSCNICALFLIFVSYPVFHLIMPFCLIQAIGMSTSSAGLMMTIPNVASIIFSPISGSLSDRFGPVWFATLGAIVNVISLLMMRCFDLQTSIAFMIPTMFLFGAGSGMFQSPNNSTIMGTVPKNRYGTTSALIALCRQVGISLGMALTGTIFSLQRGVHQAALNNSGMDAVDGTRHSIPLAFHDVLIFSIAIASISILLSLFNEKRRSN